MSYTKTTWVNNTTPIDETNLNKIESGIKNNDINIGEENYDNTKTYEVGDIVRYNEKIYKCITAITTAENFDISKWEQTNIVEIVQSEKSKIYELIEAISTPIVGEGENITLNDTAEKRFENFDIEGNSKQETREGYNLLNLTSLIGKTETKNGITYKINEDCSITVNGTPTDYTPFNLLDMSLKAGTYKFVDGLISNNVFLQTLGDFQYTSQNNTFSLAEDGNATVYLVILAGTPTLNNITLYPMIYEGTEDKPYEQYGASPSPDYPSEVESCGDNGSINEVICNKNIFNLNDYLLNMSLYSDGSIKFGQDNNLYYIPVQYGKKYIMSLNTTLATNCVYGYTNEFPSTSVKSTYNVLNISNLNNHIFEPTNPDNKYLCIRINYVSQLPQMANIQLEEGQTATEYEEHREQSYTIPTQQPMRAIGNVRDKFILKENGKWYERHYIARKIFDGTENWFTSVNSQFELLGTNYKKYKDGGTCISSHFIYSMELDTCVWIGNSSFILIRDTRYTNVNDWKSYLAEQYANGTPVYVDYVLATPTDIECTSEQTEILNQIYIKAKSYKGVTHIYSNDEVSPNCYVEAVKDLTTLIQ